MTLICFSDYIPYGLSVSAQGLFYIASHAALLQGSKIKITSLGPLDGASFSMITLSTDTDVTNADPILALKTTALSALLIWSDRASGVLRVNILGTNQILSTKMSSGKDKRIETLNIYTSATKHNAVDLLIHCRSGTSHWAEVYRIDKEPELLQKAYQIPIVEGPTAFSVAVYGEDTYLIRTTKHDVTLFSSTSNQHLGQWLLEVDDHPRSTGAYDITFAVSEVVARGKSSHAVRSAVLLSSGDWKMIHNGEGSWFRPESLSGVIAAAWAGDEGQQSLADELAAESHGSIGAAYLYRIKRHARDAKGFPQWIQGLPDRIAHSLFGTEYSSQHLGSLNDSFGFYKMLIAATDSGRLFALDMGSSGKIVWSVQASVLESGQHWAVESIEVSNDVALIRATDGGKLRISATNGTVLHDQLSSAEAGLEVTITVPDEFGSAVAININADGTLAVPKQCRVTPGTFIVTRDDRTAIYGWVLTTSEPLLVWTFHPQPNEKIVNIAARPSDDPVASVGKALGDRNVLYKFLSPNLLVIGAVNLDTSSASFYVLDAISGRILHNLNHPAVDVSQPITCVVSENWFAYTVFSKSTEGTAQDAVVSPPTTKGYQLVVSELFESPIVNDRGPLNSASNSSSLRPRAIDANIYDSGPYIISQTYVVPAAVSFMTVTSTLQGITPRSLLCVVPSLNSVFAIPRAIAEPRRPVGRDATSVEVEEGLFRHDVAIEYDPKWALNHMRELQGVRKIITAPSLLESTSLVFAFGSLDMFGTRVAPIGGFDMLGKGFNKIQLIGTVAALAVGTGILAPLVSFDLARSRVITLKQPD